MHRRILMRTYFVVCAVMFCFASSAAAQANTATLSGTIQDPQGLGVKGATITPENKWDMRVSKCVSLGERFSLELIADAFNLFNPTNVAAVNQLCDPTARSTCAAGQPTAAYDARQFQFALKLYW
jgi:hypothetical protein